MGWLIAFGVLTLLAALPLGVTVVYNMAGTRGAVILGPFRIPLFPRKKKKKVKKKEKLSEEKRKKASSAKPREESKGGSVKDFLPLVQVAQELLGAFRRKLRVNRLELKLILGGMTPAIWAGIMQGPGRRWEI